MSELKTTTTTPTKKGSSNMLVIDIGKEQKSKRIKKLRKGKGKLFDKIGTVVEDLRTEGLVDDKSTPIVIVVREKADESFRW